MRFLADENVDGEVVSRLRDAGLVTDYIAHEAPGITDDEVLKIARDRQALLLSEDKDFGEMVFRQGLTHHGVVLLRLNGLESAEKAEIVVSALQAHGDEMVGAFSVLTARSLRIRRR